MPSLILFRYIPETAESGAVLRNDAEVYTHVAVSSGEIKGRGTLWTHVLSKLVGGAIDFAQTVTHWPRQAVLFMHNLFSSKTLGSSISMFLVCHAL